MSKTKLNSLRDKEKSKSDIIKIKNQEEKVKEFRKKFYKKKEELNKELNNYQENKRNDFYKRNPNALSKFESEYFDKKEKFDQVCEILNKEEKELDKLYSETEDTKALKEIKEKIKRLEKQVWITKFCLEGELKTLNLYKKQYMKHTKNKREALKVKRKIKDQKKKIDELINLREAKENLLKGLKQEFSLSF